MSNICSLTHILIRWRLSRVELLSEIERLRAEMNGLAAVRAEYAKVLEISQKLDKLIVEYHRNVA